MPAYRTARTTRAQQLQWPSSPPPRSSLPPPLSSSPLRRASSPFLPELVLPPTSTQTPRQDLNTRLRHAEEEQERMIMNEMVCDLQAAPDNSVMQQEYVFKRDDYEERFGKFVPDSEHGAWFARRDSEHKALCAWRELIVDLSPFKDGAKLQEYFDKEDAFATEFGITFGADDGNDATLQNKRQLLHNYKKLLQRANGDMDVAARIAGRNYILNVVNPFQVKDDRRMEFDLKLRRWAAKLQGVDIATLEPTFGNIKFRFELANKFETGDERRLHYWCQRRVWAGFIKEEEAAAHQQARLLPPVRRPVSPSTFYGRSY
ncbi:hypothetical protein GGX14DRAFT_576154 [Mycena pura]|uniref:Uncharacterized protein n=1 Tax=Mycena pura TaxID=153505 RepID=A0AAD6UXP7_9AGAR|nr:hypothetical protein GGX14DRAFT_576154 [Mycena pura]